MPPPLAHDLTSVCTRACGVALLALLVLLAGACNGSSGPDAFIARVGEAYLTQEDLQAALETLPERQDTSEARLQLINQWVRNELLYQEALRLELRNDAVVQERLRESERSVLIDALVARLYEEAGSRFSNADIRVYYERHKDQLRLREPFVRVHYLACAHPDSAGAAREALRNAVQAAAVDSLWPALVARFAEDTEGSLSLAENYVPENHLFTRQPALRQRLIRLRPGEVSPVLSDQARWHVVLLADRVATGTIPELPWVEQEVRRLMLIDARKQMYERQVERLRTESQARDGLEVR